MFELLKSSVDFRALQRPVNIEYHRVFDTVKETGAHHFLHGVAVDEWHDRLVVCFAYNDGAENSVTEKLYSRWSDDGGRTWSPVELIAHSTEHANSHSVFLSTPETLWCFGPRFNGLGERPVTKKGAFRLHFLQLQMEAWSYDGAGWTSHGIVTDDFWPLGAPVRMDNGNWMISGCDKYWRGAIAVSHGDDLLHWDVCKPDVGEEVFTEAAAWAQGNRVLSIMRNESTETGGQFNAAVALSEDFGRTFAPCEVSNLPIATTKPFCGILSDGRPYMIFNESTKLAPHDRARLLLGVGEPGEFAIRRLWQIDEGHPTPDGRRLHLSYPYAKQLGSKLYIAYSYESAPGTRCNHNDAMLAIVNVEDLNRESE